MKVDDLELSVRTANVLRREGITDIDAFMLLRPAEILRWPHAGRKTANEIADVQRWLTEEKNTYGERALVQAASHLNSLLLHGPSGMRVTVNSDGLVELYRRVT